MVSSKTSSSQTIYDSLKEIRLAKVADFFSQITIVEPSHVISKVIGLMSESDTYDVYCLTDQGVLTTNAREILNAKEVGTTKISSLLHKINPLSNSDTVEKAATLMSHYRMRSFPIVENSKFSGVINAKNVLNILAKENLNWLQANSVLTPNPIVLPSKESIAKARSIMMSRRIDHIPISYKEKINHVLTSMHLMRLISPSERIGVGQRGTNLIKRFESEIGNIGSTRIPYCSTNDPINTVINKMLEANTSCSLITLWGNLHGIITFGDILNLITTQVQSKAPLYIVGMPDDYDNSEIIKKKFQKIINNLIKGYPEVEEARTSIKEIHNPSNKRKKFEVSVRIITPYKTHNYFESEWDLSKAFDSLGTKILRNLSKHKKKRWKTSIRKIDKKDLM